LTGPGGFIDISQSTKNICFMTTMTAKGLHVSTPGDGTLKIANEGKVKKFVPNIFEKTFSGDEAVRRGQNVMYVTERAVFQRSGESDKLELVEIAPGIDLQKDILDQMDFMPKISPNLETMDPRMFMKQKMGILAELFGTLEERCVYHPQDHTVFFDLFGITLNEEDDVTWLINGLRSILKPLVDEYGPINMVASYDGFDVRKGLEHLYEEKVNEIEKEMYKSVKRYTGHAFKRAKLKSHLNMSSSDPDNLFEEFGADQNGVLSTQQLRDGFVDHFQIHLTPSNIQYFLNGTDTISKDRFIHGMKEVFHHN
jgi:propionate CoA-transferase